VGFLSHLFYPWGLILQGLAIVHFIRRRPDTFWIYVILFLGPIGALVYLFAEALPDIGLARHSFQGFSRRKRIGQLITAIRDNPSSGNFEELATSISKKTSSSRRVMRTTRPSPPVPAPLIRFTDEGSVPSC
jgi:hypothetical protein